MRSEGLQITCTTAKSTHISPNLPGSSKIPGALMDKVQITFPTRVVIKMHQNIIGYTTHPFSKST
jgi:hypothetical protein